ncbi:MAG: hypothetical protein SO147_01655 [Clostridia bacterium]|nr:hypothetical protein [Clostridia bacterium]
MVKLLIAGDFCVKNFEESFFTRKRIQQIAAPFKELTEQQDISVVNVETVYSDCEAAVPKSAPNLKSPFVTLDLLYEAYCEGRMEEQEPYKQMLQRLQTGAVL